VVIACWSVKGGSGTTVVAAALALLAARTSHGALLVDLAGDAPAALGLPDPAGPGVAGWLASDAGPDALARLQVEGAPGLAVLPQGGPLPSTPARAHALAEALAASERAVVVDSGTLPREVAGIVVERAAVSLLVIRPCYLALRRAVTAPLRPHGIVLVTEPGRALGRLDVEQVLAVPVRAEVPLDPAIARAVDAGLTAGRLPRLVERALRDAA